VDEEGGQPHGQEGTAVADRPDGDAGDPPRTVVAAPDQRVDQVVVEGRVAGTDDEGERSVDRVAVGRHDPPGDHVAAVVEVAQRCDDVRAVDLDAPAVDSLKYQAAKPADAAADTTELLTVKLRYKQPDGDTSSYLEFPLSADAMRRIAKTTPDFRFAAAVAAFGQLLRESEHLKKFGYADVLALADPALGNDPFGYRTEFLKLVRNAKVIDGR